MVEFDKLQATTAAVDIDRLTIKSFEEGGAADASKIEIISKESDVTCATFLIRNEDHTVSNALRYVIMNNPMVEYCGYSIPHPSEAKVHFRIQTKEGLTALDAIKKGLDDLMELSKHILGELDQALDEGDYIKDE